MDVARGGSVQQGHRSRYQKERGPTALPKSVRQRPDSAGGCRSANRRDYCGDAGRHLDGHVLRGAPGSLLRCRHRGGPWSHVRRRLGHEGRKAGGRDLLDLLAARLRQHRARRSATGATSGLRHGPRRYRGRGRAHASRRARHRLYAEHSWDDRYRSQGRQRDARTAALGDAEE